GYCDSLTGLIFFLLCGRAFQNRAHERLAFDRDYRAFFPLAVTRLRADPGRHAPAEERVALSQLRVGDRLRIRNGELIPADARLVSGQAQLDYSFVTGESQPVDKRPGEHLYAGGRQVGAAIEVELVKPVSESYLASLWNHEAFRKTRGDEFHTLTNRYARRFTWIVLGIAVAAGVFWLASGHAPRGIKAFTSVLIVACPCALALAAPFTLGTAHRILARHGVFLKNAQVIEHLARVDTVVFDKTGTLTTAGTSAVQFVPGVARDSLALEGEAQGEGEARRGVGTSVSQEAFSLTPALSRWERENHAAQRGSASDLSAGSASHSLALEGEGRGELTEAQARWIASLARHSTHPLAVRISQWFNSGHEAPAVESFREVPGCGIEGCVEGHC
ncbi:MAG: HAD-IC family P-type ATPase, partial [Verrucomicrobiales bacterium]|nr:HAD-IC family P-type ATPase [Verrucomicrobiales bacterium]